MEQVIALGQPRLVAASVSTIFAVIADVCHQPLLAHAKDGGAVKLMEIIRRRHDETVFIRRAHFIVDGLHHGLRNGVGLGNNGGKR